MIPNFMAHCFNRILRSPEITLIYGHPNFTERPFESQPSHFLNLFWENGLDADLGSASSSAILASRFFWSSMSLWRSLQVFAHNLNWQQMATSRNEERTTHHTIVSVESHHHHYHHHTDRNEKLNTNISHHTDN